MPVSSEKTMFMKWEDDHFILHGTFVDDFATVPTSEKLKEEFASLYSADFDVTGGALMESFVGLEVEQSEEGTRLHLDTYIQELIEKYLLLHKKFINRRRC